MWTKWQRWIVALRLPLSLPVHHCYSLCAPLEAAVVAWGDMGGMGLTVEVGVAKVSLLAANKLIHGDQ